MSGKSVSGLSLASGAGSSVADNRIFGVQVGITKEKAKLKRMRQIITNPGTYLDDKISNISGIEAQVGDAYSDSLEGYLDSGYHTIDEARERATKDTKQLYDHLMSEHNIRFPVGFGDVDKDLLNVLKLSR